jgi:hypothetical protein
MVGYRWVGCYEIKGLADHLLRVWSVTCTAFAVRNLNMGAQSHFSWAGVTGKGTVSRD